MENENTFCCGACGEIASHSEGEQITNNGFAEFVHRADKCEVALDEAEEKKEIVEEVTSILQEYTDIVKKFWRLYEELDDETADKLTKAGAEKWLKYAFTLSMDELWFESMSWELTKEDLETKPMKCDICQTTEKLLTESDKATLRPNWAGVDFYNGICIPCWNAQKDIR
jgi:hypothetical protein